MARDRGQRRRARGSARRAAGGPSRRRREPRHALDDAELAAIAAAAAVLHAQAGADASRGGPIAALDIAEHLPGVVARLLGGATGAEGTGGR
ncbi:hypothetical protein [Rathayibacter sp. VKM Ac-2760]|uniref:hypothetical protein n=1 Tax=Rathayibacter sp. VKM Ac-2760 TaxID=2609253 RepID=UPI003297A170